MSKIKEIQNKIKELEEWLDNHYKKPYAPGAIRIAYEQELNELREQEKQLLK